MIRSIGRVPAERTTTYKIRHLYNGGEDELATPGQPQLNLLQNAAPVSYAEGAISEDGRPVPKGTTIRIVGLRQATLVVTTAG